MENFLSAIIDSESSLFTPFEVFANSWRDIVLVGEWKVDLLAQCSFLFRSQKLLLFRIHLNERSSWHIFVELYRLSPRVFRTCKRIVIPVHESVIMGPSFRGLSPEFGPLRIVLEDHWSRDLLIDGCEGEVVPMKIEITLGSPMLFLHTPFRSFHCLAMHEMYRLDLSLSALCVFLAAYDQLSSKICTRDRCRTLFH